MAAIARNTPATCARVCSSAPLVSMTQWAKRRFSRSGVWRARIASNLAALMPGRASARARCAASLALTTRTRSTAACPRGLDQQRHVDDDDPPPLRGGPLEKRSAQPRHLGMNDRLQALQRPGIGEARSGELFAIDLPALDHAGKGGLHRLGARRAIEFAHRRVGVEHRSAERREHPGDGGLAHRDRTRQSRDDHERPFSAARMSASTSARNCGVTVGRTPNQRSNPGVA